MMLVLTEDELKALIAEALNRRGFEGGESCDELDADDVSITVKDEDGAEIEDAFVSISVDPVNLPEPTKAQ